MLLFALITIFLGLKGNSEVYSIRNSHNVLDCFSCFLRHNCPRENYCSFGDKKAFSGQNNSRTENGRSSPKQCEIEKRSRAVELSCHPESDCLRPLPMGTTVHFKCPPFYQAPTTTAHCGQHGVWSSPVKCTPECGKTHPNSMVTPLIMNGRNVEFRSQWPWAAALYYLVNGNYTYKCGATLVGDDMLLTAAFCIHNTASSDLLVVINENIPSFVPQDKAYGYGFKVKRTYVLPVYRSEENGHNSDISVLVLESPLTLSRKVLPACLPPLNTSLEPNTEAIVAGWGSPTVETSSLTNRLTFMKVPIVDAQHCSNKLPKNIVKNLAFTVFCAGYTNGTGTCYTDNGSGLLTKNRKDLWELQGIVSVNKGYRGGPCHDKMYSLYTKVFLFVEWIAIIVEFEEKGAPDKANSTSPISQGRL